MIPDRVLSSFYAENRKPRVNSHDAPLERIDSSLVFSECDGADSSDFSLARNPCYHKVRIAAFTRDSLKDSAREVLHWQIPRRLKTS